MEEEASAGRISLRISFSHDLAATAACPATTQPEPSRLDASLMSRRRRVPEPEFDFANAAAADIAPADRLFADGKLLPVPPRPPTAPHARCLKQPQAAAWQKTATRPPAPRSWASPFARSSTVNSRRFNTSYLYPRSSHSSSPTLLSCVGWPLNHREEASAELISPRISFSHDLATFAAACPATTQPEPSRSDASVMRRRRAPEPEFDFANAAAADVAPADRLFADGKLLPVPPLPPTAPHSRCVKPPQAAAWQKATTRPAPRSWASPFARGSSVNSAAAFPLMRSRSVGSAAATAATVGAHRPHCQKVAPTTIAPSNSDGDGGAAEIGLLLRLRGWQKRWRQTWWWGLG